MFVRRGSLKWTHAFQSVCFDSKNVAVLKRTMINHWRWCSVPSPHRERKRERERVMEKKERSRPEWDQMEMNTITTTTTTEKSHLQSYIIVHWDQLQIDSDGWRCRSKPKSSIRKRSHFYLNKLKRRESLRPH